MALIRNGSNQLTGLSRFHGAVGAYGLRSALDNSGKRNNFDSGEHAVSGVTNKAAIPSGASHPIAWRLPTKAGSLASANEAEGSCTATLSLASGINIAGLAEGTTPTAEATLQLVVSMLASAAGVATVEGNINAALGLSGTASGEATESAIISALAWAIGQADGSSTAALTSYATGRLYGAITPFTDLSPENLASAVWSALASQYNDSGTMGEKMNGAGSAGNPWTEIIESGYSAAEILRIVAASLAGEVSGADTSNITFKGIDGTTDRITASVDTNGNRLTVTLDGN